MKDTKYKTSIFRLEHFNAAHQLNVPDWDEKKNRAVFGKCNNANFHGHNYELEVKLTGFVDPQTGFVMDTKELSDIINKEIIERFDHKNLNLDVEEFKNLNPTAENIAIVIYNLLRKNIDTKNELKIKLYETPRNYVEYPA
ncbi:MAG: 6-carboxytetrahydropterin synthase [Bacteroidales bacterium]|nr:6-carboxytetrahydropterin synthase [Bacteroidales bacterium]MCF8455787.1 6-carboxytetrahydropterin synthase [Bacteroidales bacterium]